MQSDLKDQAAQLLGHIGRSDGFELIELEGGANNRVFRLQLTGQAFLLKAYFHDERDHREIGRAHV